MNVDSSIITSVPTSIITNSLTSQTSEKSKIISLNKGTITTSKFKESKEEIFNSQKKMLKKLQVFKQLVIEKIIIINNNAENNEKITNAGATRNTKSITNGIINENI